MKHITKEQRYQIEAYLKSGKSVEFIAVQIRVHRSNLYRELKRNALPRGSYNAKQAQLLCDERKERFARKRSFTHEIEKRIRNHIQDEQWSPKQIVGYCKKNNIPTVSHERIYQFVREDKLQGGDLYKNLRHQLKHRKRPVGGRLISIKNRVLIDERSDIINNKERFGDWEIDTIVGKNNEGAIVTIVERTTAFFMMRKLPQGKHASFLANEVIDMLRPYKNSVHSITSDNGTEFAQHQKIAKKLNSKFYFAHPYSSWERGLSEYTNKLIRQYVPKKSDFSKITNDYLIDIQHKINRRPREKLEFQNPKTIFFSLVN